MDRLIQAKAVGENWIRLSEHNQEKDLLFPNSLDIEIVNVSCVETVSFINQLPVGVPIPDIDVTQNQVSVIYVYFPLGDGDEYLTSKRWAEQMACYAPYNWGVERTLDPNGYGVYFKLFPLSDQDLAPQEKMYVNIRNLVSFGNLEKMVYVAVRFTHILLSGGDTVEGDDFLAYFKKRPPLQILNLECSRSKVAVGDTVKIEWAVAGNPEDCILTPGDIPVQAVGSLETEVFKDTTFRIHAFSQNEQISKASIVYVDRPVIRKFTSNCPNHRTKYGLPVILSYEVQEGYGVYLNQGIGRMQDNSVSVVPMAAETEYILNCMAPDALVQERLVITVTDYLEVLQLIYTRSRQTDGSYQYYLKWEVANCITIKITTSDGLVRSSGEASGKIQFPDQSVEALSVTLYCTGTSGQVIDQVYTI